MRSMVARELIEKYSFTQSSAAKKIGITQAAISWYMMGKRGSVDRRDHKVGFMEDNSAVQALVKDLAAGIANDTMSPSERIHRVCGTCITSIRPSHDFCRFHLSLSQSIGKCEVCHVLPA